MILQYRTPCTVARWLPICLCLSRYLAHPASLLEDRDIPSVLLVYARIMFSSSECYALSPSFCVIIYDYHHLDLAITPLYIVFPRPHARRFSQHFQRRLWCSRETGVQSLPLFLVEVNRRLVPPPKCLAPVVVTTYKCAISPRQQETRKIRIFCHGFGNGVAFVGSDGLVDIRGARGE